MQENDSLVCSPARGRNLRGAGFGYLGTAMAFLAVGVSGQPAFIGVGCAFIGLAVALIARGRRER
jgi:hypothetical protein